MRSQRVPLGAVRSLGVAGSFVIHTEYSSSFSNPYLFAYTLGVCARRFSDRYVRYLQCNAGSERRSRGRTEYHSPLQCRGAWSSKKPDTRFFLSAAELEPKPQRVAVQDALYVLHTTLTATYNYFIKYFHKYQLLFRFSRRVLSSLFMKHSRTVKTKPWDVGCSTVKEEDCEFCLSRILTRKMSVSNNNIRRRVARAHESPCIISVSVVCNTVMTTLFGHITIKLRPLFCKSFNLRRLH